MLFDNGLKKLQSLFRQSKSKRLYVDIYRFFSVCKPAWIQCFCDE